MVHTNKFEEPLSQDALSVQCFKCIDLNCTVIACMGFATQPSCASAIGGTPTYVFAQAGLASVGIVVSWSLMSYCGRCILYVWGLGGLIANFITLGVISGSISELPEESFAQAGFVLAWQAVCYVTVGPICNAIITEISSTRINSKNVCLNHIACYIAQSISNIVDPYMLNPTAGNWKHKTGVAWGGCAFLFYCPTVDAVRLPKGLYELGIGKSPIRGWHCEEQTFA